MRLCCNAAACKIRSVMIGAERAGATRVVAAAAGAAHRTVVMHIVATAALRVLLMCGTFTMRRRRSYFKGNRANT